MDKKKISSYIRRVIGMLVGLYLASTGVNLTIKANIGASPMGCIPAVFSAPLGVSVGTVMGAMCIGFVIAEIIIFRKNFPPFQILQLAVSVVYGWFTDLSAKMISGLPSGSILMKVVLCACGIAVLAFGIAVLIRADVLMLSPDAMLVRLSKTFGYDYGKIKIIMDSSFVVVAGIGSLLIAHKLQYIGIGTVAAAIFVGMLAGRIKKWSGLNALLDRLMYS